MPLPYCRFLLNSVFLFSAILVIVGCTAVPSGPGGGAGTEGSSKTAAPESVETEEAADTKAAKSGEGQKGESEEARELQLDPKITSGTLENGVKYYVRKNEKPGDRLQVRLAVNAGSVQETKEQRGLAHFVEHMAFNGTEKYEKHAIVDYLERTGMRFGPDINAYTSFDETVYKLDLPTDEEGIVDKGMEILKEWAFRIAFDPEEVEKEKGVIVEEWRLGRGAGARMRDEYWPVLMRGSKYAERLPIGSMEVVRNSGPEDLRAYYERWYRPDNMAVIVVGDAEPKRMVELIRKYFAPAEQPESGLERPRPEGPEAEKQRFVTATDPEAQNTSVELVGFHEAFDLNTEADYRTYLTRRLYRDMIESRLSEKTEQSNPPFVYGYFSLTSFIRPSEASVWGSMAKEGEVESALRTLAREALRVDRHGFRESELERAKESLRSAMQRAYEERDKTESVRFAEEYVRHYLTGEAVPGIAREWELTQRFLPEIRMEDISRIHDRYTTQSGAATVLVTGPEKEGLEYPDRDELRSIFTEVQQSSIEPYEDEIAGKELMDREPKPGRIVSEGSEQQGDYRYFELANGARVYYKKTDFKNEEILFSAFSPGGASTVSTGNYYAAVLAPTFVSASGLGDHSPSELRKLMSGKQAKVGAYVQELYEGFRGSARPQDLEYLFQQLHLYFTEPREDAALFSSYRGRLANVLQNRRNRPEVRLSDTVTSLLYDDNPRRAPLTAEKVQAIEAEQAYDLFRRRFSGAEDFTFFFVGNLDPDRLKGLAARYIGSLEEGSDEQWIDRNVRYTSEAARRTVKAGMASKSTVRLLYCGSYDWSLEENSLLSSLRQLLEIRLREEVREEAGGTYGVGVSVSTNRYPAEEYLIRIGFSCDPERVKELTGIIERELERLAEEGVDEGDLEKVSSIRRSSLEEARKTNDFWRSFLESRVKYDLDPGELLAKEERIEAVGAGDLQQAVRRYLLDATELRVVLLPEEDAGNDGEKNGDREKEEKTGGR
jgi:zinc protease